jgi:hypothetical protein
VRPILTTDNCVEDINNYIKLILTMSTKPDPQNSPIGRSSNVPAIISFLIICALGWSLLSALSQPTKRTAEEEAAYQKHKQVVTDTEIAIRAWKPLTKDSKIAKTPVREQSVPVKGSAGIFLKLEQPSK